MVLLAVVAIAIAQRGDEDPYADYCDRVAEHQQEIGAALGDGEAATGFLRALPALEDVAAAAPRDIRDEWRLVLDRITGLADALDAAGVDASSYDPATPPAGVAPEDLAAIEIAATSLGADDSRTALRAVDQQVRDVCGTPLSL